MSASITCQRECGGDILRPFFVRRGAFLSASNHKQNPRPGSQDLLGIKHFETYHQLDFAGGMRGFTL